jgi:hypothetical protein
MAEGGINGGLTDSRRRSSPWEESGETEACGVFLVEVEENGRGWLQY